MEARVVQDGIEHAKQWCEARGISAAEWKRAEDMHRDRVSMRHAEMWQNAPWSMRIESAVREVRANVWNPTGKNGARS